MSDRPPAGRTETEYVPSGEAQGQEMRFSASRVAEAFGVAVERVHRALAGEFNLPPEAAVDSKQAQQLAEVLIGDQPLDQQEAGLMQLGAFTPRRDQEWGLGETPPGEESDRLAASADALEDEVASERSSNDPSYPTG